jgi:hypothetical protein
VRRGGGRRGRGLLSEQEISTRGGEGEGRGMKKSSMLSTILNLLEIQDELDSSQIFFVFHDLKFKEWFLNGKDF